MDEAELAMQGGPFLEWYEAGISAMNYTSLADQTDLMSFGKLSLVTTRLIPRRPASILAEIRLRQDMVQYEMQDLL